MSKKNSGFTPLLLIGLLLFLTVSLLPGLRSEAADAKAPSCAKSQTLYFYRIGSNNVATTCYSSYIYVKNLAADAQITNVKSSNKKIVAGSIYNVSEYANTNIAGVSIDTASGSYANPVLPKSGTKSKITFTVKQNGKSYKLSCTVTLKYAPSPVSTFKIGGKDYSSLFRGNVNTDTTFLSVKAKKAKLTFKATSGFKIDSILLAYRSGTAYSSKTVKKSGTTISTKNLSAVLISYHATKKPANYSAPLKWGGKVPSPLHEYVEIYAVNK